MTYAGIIIDISADAVDKAFTYIVPSELEGILKPGVRVKVPFGNSGRLRRGVVIELKDKVDYDESKLKPINSVEEGAPDTEQELIELAAYMAEEYGCTMNQALMTVLPVKARVRKNSRRRDAVKSIREYAAKENGSAGSTADAGEVCTSGSSQSKAGSSCDSADSTGDRHLPDINNKSEANICSEKGETNGHENFLNMAQQRVADEIISDRSRPSLLYGITGSGKTRVYIELIRRMQQESKQTIVLIPEIALTFQIVNELSDYFGDRVAVMHSRLSAGERYDQFERAVNGEIDIMVGPRSALFTPFKRLGLIIIDEEHERTYQSETSPRYDTREVARKRAKLSGAKLLLGSATPSLASYTKALKGEYLLHKLKERAHPGAMLPRILVEDMRKELSEGNRSIFSAKLKELIEDRLQKKEQVMLFINRRGYAGFVSCRSCGHVIKCPHCDVSLTAHNNWYVDPRTGNRDAALLSCHYCGYTAAMPKTCPECGSNYIAPFGTGTQKLELACRNTFPKARILRMDADTTAAKHAYERILSDFKAHKADILIGTQMIVKGHDFENVTLVGIVAADMSLNTSEYDASERCYQLITQAAGRSGRGDRPGEVVIQSYDPSHYAISCAAGRDYESFYEREMSYRKLLNYPPETYMLFVRLRSEDEASLDTAAEKAAAISRAYEAGGTQVIGPCRESIYKINDNYRKIIYIKDKRHDIITKIREAITAQAGEASSPNTRVYINFDIR